MYHQITIVGRATKDCEMKFIPSGKAVSNFNLAIDDGWGDNKKTIWVKVSCWEKLAETCNNFMKKGKLILVTGTLNASENGNPRSWVKDGEAHAAYEVTAREVRFLSPKDSQEDAPF